MWRDVALFNLAIDGKLRACDTVRLRLDALNKWEFYAIRVAACSSIILR